MVALGFNYRIDEPRAALGLSRLGRLEDERRCRERLDLRYRTLLDAMDSTLKVTTALSSPGPDCIVTFSLTKPYSLVKGDLTALPMVSDGDRTLLMACASTLNCWALPEERVGRVPVAVHPRNAADGTERCASQPA